APNRPITFLPNILLGVRGLERTLTIHIANSLLAALGFLFVLLLLSMLLRREWLAVGVVWLVTTIISTLPSDYFVLDFIFSGILSAAILFVLLRYGLLSTIIMYFFITLSVWYPFTTDFSAWYAPNALIALSLGIALVVYGFYISLAGQPIFRGG